MKYSVVRYETWRKIALVEAENEDIAYEMCKINPSLFGEAECLGEDGNNPTKVYEE